MKTDIIYLKFSSLPWKRNAYSPMYLGEEGNFVCCFHIPILVLMEGKKHIFTEAVLPCCYIFCTPLDSYHGCWLSISRTGSRLTGVTNHTPSCPRFGLVLHLHPSWNFGIKGVFSAPSSNQLSFREVFLHDTGGRVEQLHPKGRWSMQETVKTRQLWEGWVSFTLRLQVFCFFLASCSPNYK